MDNATLKLKKMEKQPITINISTLIGNLIIVAKDMDEASESFEKKLTETLARIIKAAQGD